MKKLIKKLLYTLLISLFSAGIGLAADMDSQALTLVKLDDQWSAAAVKKDTDLVVSFYTDDATVYPPNDIIGTGHDGAKKIWGAMLSDPSLTISWKAQHGEIASSGDIGYTSGTYELSMKGPDGKPINDKGKFLCVWKKQSDGKWKALRDMWNSDLK